MKASRLAVTPRGLAVLLAVGVLQTFAAVDANATLSLSADQSDNAPSGAPLSAQTQRLFQAVRDGELASVQQAVLDGADLQAVNADGVRAADLAESLDRFAIALFLRAYQAIEERPGAPTTVVETEGPAPVPPPENLDAAPTSSSTASSLTAPVSELFGETGGSALKQTSPVKQETSAGDYFSRLSTLNPTHEMPESVPPAPTGQIVEGDDTLQNLTVIAETPSEMQEVSEQEPENRNLEQFGESAEASDVMTAFTPQLPRRKPPEDLTAAEPEIFMSVGREQPPVEPEPVAEANVMMLPEVSMPVETADPVAPEEGSFFGQMRVFDEAPSSGQPPAEPPADGSAMPDPMKTARNTGVLTEYEQIRAAVIEKLRRESDARSKQLADVRGELHEEFEQEDMIREHESGAMNIQTELRAKQRMALTGTSLPPGYVPPPDGGSSGIRFLQRLGLYDTEDPFQVAETRDLRQSGLPSGSSSYTPPVLMDAGESILLPVLTPEKLTRKSMAFIDNGYSAPPAGQTLNTSDDTAVAALGQIARLFQTPNIGYPSKTSALPTPGTLPSAISTQGVFGGITMPQSSSGAPLNSADLATPPPISSGVYGNENGTQPVTVPEFPVGPSALTEIGDPFQSTSPATSPGWDATTTDNQGDVVARPRRLRPPIPLTMQG